MHRSPLAAGHDAVTTRRAGSGFSHRRAGATSDSSFLLGGLDEIYADRVAIDPGQLAAPVRQASGREQQEKLFQGEPLDRAFDGELGAGLRNVFHGAIAAPGAVDAHHVRLEAALEGNALAFAAFCNHDCNSLNRRMLPQPKVELWAKINAGPVNSL